jgi:hypothetical protein
VVSSEEESIDPLAPTATMRLELPAVLKTKSDNPGE